MVIGGNPMAHVMKRLPWEERVLGSSSSSVTLASFLLVNQKTVCSANVGGGGHYRVKRYPIKFHK